MIEVGLHRLTNESIEHPAVDAMLAGETVQVLYTDPPWGDGTMKYWATLNRKATGRECAPLTYAQLVARIRDLIVKYVRGHVFIETGARWEAETVAAVAAVLGPISVFRLSYRSGSKLLEYVLLYAPTPGVEPVAVRPEGLRGGALVKECVRAAAVPCGIALDPCCGMGYSARAAVAAGMRFRGNEFNAKRLQQTVDFLTRG